MTLLWILALHLHAAHASEGTFMLEVVSVKMLRLRLSGIET